MTDPAHSGTGPTHNHRSTRHGERPSPQAQASAQGDSLLRLTGGRPVTVNMSVIAENVVVFWQPPPPGGQLQLYTGIRWVPDIYALMITFVFAELPEGAVLPASMSTPLSVTAMVSEMIPTTPALWFSDTFPESNPTSQMCCVPSTLGEYHFDALVTDGVGHTKRYRSLDPKIVVTPINGTL
jgi:hypothetical protein